MLIRVLIVSFYFTVSTVSFAQDMGHFPITQSWYLLKDDNLKQEPSYVIFRKYSIVVNRDIDGKLSLDNLRNSLLFHCSFKKLSPTYLNIILPRELDLASILGKVFEDEYQVRMSIDGVQKSFLAEMHSNQIFIDNIEDKGHLIDEILLSKEFEITLQNGSSLKFSTFGEFVEPLWGYGSFDELVHGSLKHQVEEVITLPSKDMVETCSGLSPNF